MVTFVCTLQIINWMQNRFNGRQDKGRSEAAVASSARGECFRFVLVISGRTCFSWLLTDEPAFACMGFTSDVPVRESCRQDHAREEKSPNGDWPQALLSIGTLGNESPLHAAAATATAEVGGPRASSQADVPDFTIEEVKKLQDALNKLLRRAKSKSSARGSEATDEDRANQMPLDRFLNCPSSLEVDRRLSLKQAANEGEGGEFSPDTQIILSKARDLLVNSNGATVKQKSFKFLLKKMFVCRGCFAPAPSLKDPIESRMEKVTVLAIRSIYDLLYESSVVAGHVDIYANMMLRTFRVRVHTVV
ncbi:protein NEGATIVE GRAVITROPIC RESPONSE OF ROOTS-like [Phragmites australis]|uniref:protein NEGATIVE GRAVITROPIC RESPONSE OF ROOTS-like n=1 Tax=Phragmites australis TaxID=29695 RepID=UPI002D775FD6|nr:protein NEGATIVE GRAVITROPIC RESPONSE OF ROOTS-like [Phragmites australis]